MLSEFGCVSMMVIFLVDNTRNTWTLKPVIISEIGVVATALQRYVFTRQSSPSATFLFCPFVSMLDMGVYELFNITLLAAKNTIFES